VDAVGLTEDQLIESFGDEATTLPEGITRPKTWPSLKNNYSAQSASGRLSPDHPWSEDHVATRTPLTRMPP
jgi:hypothetical protein